MFGFWGLVKARKDWRKPEGLAVSRKVDGWSFFYTGLGIEGGVRQESGEAVEVCECMMYGVCISVISVKNVYYTYT